jgi:hypothetical protein
MSEWVKSWELAAVRDSIHHRVEFEVLTAVVMKTCYLLGYNVVQSVKVLRRFGGTCSVCLQGRRISQAKKPA